MSKPISDRYSITLVALALDLAAAQKDLRSAATPKRAAKIQSKIDDINANIAAIHNLRNNGK